MMLTLKHYIKYYVRPYIIPIIRSYIRYIPIESLKSTIWKHIVEPYIQWASYDFIARSVFNFKIKGNTVDMIQRYIYYFGIWEPNLSYYICKHLREGDVFVDVGSNVGYYSLLASNIVGKTGAVVAIEASPDIYNELLCNISINSFSNIRPVNIAASNTNGIVNIYESNSYNKGEASIIAPEAVTKSYEIAAMPLVDILHEDELRRARFVKIDVEGAELFVVEGMIPLLYNGREDLEVVLEVSPERLMRLGKRPEQLIQLFEDAGFHGYLIENSYSTYSYIKTRVTNPSRMNYGIQGQADILFSRKDTDIL